VSHAAELSQQFEECERERVAYRIELREIKTRESRIMGDCAELEDENILLQKQLMQLKQAQVQLHRTCLRCIPMSGLHVEFCTSSVQLMLHC